MNLVCINCPLGCHITIEKVNDEFIVKGNTCPRGKEYAINELTNPLRTLTTTVNLISSSLKRLPVISSKALPKDKLLEASKALKDVKVKAPVKLGDVIYKNILGLDVDILASKSVLK